MVATLSQPKMHSREVQNSLTLILVLECGGSAHSKEEINGSGKSEFSTEEIAVVEDSMEQRSALEVKNVVQLRRAQRTDNGTKSDVPSHLEVIKSSLKPQERIISQSLE
jgi:hypothetical protein